VPNWSRLAGERKGEPENEWTKAYLPIRNIPKGWSHVKKEMIWIDPEQFFYQNYKSGNFSQSFYSNLLANKLPTPDTSQMSASAIKSYVYVIWGVDQNANWAAMVDTNNNLDFSDEEPFHPELIKDVVEDAKRHSTSGMVTYERVHNGKVFSAKIPVAVKMFRGDFVYNFPRYASSKLNVDGLEHEILISTGFTSLSFEDAGLFYQASRNKEADVFANQLIEVGQVINVGNVILPEKFKNHGVARKSGELTLEGIASGVKDGQDIIQAEYMLRPFTANEFITGRNITLNSVRGKYVYLDFWGTWCKGCVMQIPELNKLYNSVDKSKIEFIGIAHEDSISLAKGIEKYNIQWPQIRADSINNLLEKYKVTGFPKTMLLDKEGRILAIDMHVDELREKLNQLNLNKPVRQARSK
jgi:thiol-disulfide isomerase/thioredoxin